MPSSFDGAFDIIYCFDVFPHCDLHTMQAYFARFRRMLKRREEAKVGVGVSASSPPSPSSPSSSSSSPSSSSPSSSLPLLPRIFVHTANLAAPLGWERFSKQRKFTPAGFYFVTPEVIQVLSERNGFQILKRSAPFSSSSSSSSDPSVVACERTMYYNRDFLCWLAPVEKKEEKKDGNSSAITSAAADRSLSSSSSSSAPASQADSKHSLPSSPSSPSSSASVTTATQSRPANSTSPLSSSSLFLSLPLPLLQLITSFLPDNSFASLSVTCSHFVRCCEADLLWRRRFIERWPEDAWVLGPSRDSAEFKGIRVQGASARECFIQKAVDEAKLRKDRERAAQARAEQQQQQQQRWQRGKFGWYGWR